MADSSRWHDAERLFHATLARAEGERSAFLREACGGDEALRRDVDSLLTFERDAQAFMHDSALEVAAAHVQPVATTPIIGQRLGPYEIGPLLGFGGMGDVYQARDMTLGRDVAIKILPEAFTADADRRARFEREARVLAALNHPYIGAIAEDVWNEAGGGATDFAVSDGVLVYRERQRNLGELVWFDRAGQSIGSAGARADYIHPWLSPDGRRAAVEIVEPETQMHSVWVVDLVRGSRAQFATGPAQSHFPVWSPDGRSILFSSDRGGPLTLVTKPATGTGPEHELLAPAMNSCAIDWSVDGRFILYQTTHPSTRTDIWALPVAPRSEPFAVANTPSNERQAQVPPDGRWVAYTSNMSGRDEIWVQRFPYAGKNGRCRLLVEANRSGAATDGSCSTSRKISS